jgi:hypothetical protein
VSLLTQGTASILTDASLGVVPSADQEQASLFSSTLKEQNIFE